MSSSEKRGIPCSRAWTEGIPNDAGSRGMNHGPSSRASPGRSQGGPSEDRGGSHECIGLCPLDVEFKTCCDGTDPPVTSSSSVVADIHRPGGVEPTEVASGSHVETPDACSIRNGHLQDRDVGGMVEREVTAEVSEVAGSRLEGDQMTGPPRPVSTR
jgi:hypothetical protein